VAACALQNPCSSPSGGRAHLGLYAGPSARRCHAEPSFPRADLRSSFRHHVSGCYVSKRGRKRDSLMEDKSGRYSDTPSGPRARPHADSLPFGKLKSNIKSGSIERKKGAPHSAARLSQYLRKLRWPQRVYRKGTMQVSRAVQPNHTGRATRGAPEPKRVEACPGAR
jgi:hypothetical protein